MAFSGIFKMNSNRLAQTSSPYLQQHAHNPVDWYPWGKEAIEKARAEHKPILLSIGYAACHWCHVMAHESFEDKETADLMNKLFVNIKVDREERPDLDKIYQKAHYLLTQSHGGWPLTVFLTADDLTPFFSGTYFPREPHYQLPVFKDILKTLASIYQNNFADIKQQNAMILNILNQETLHQGQSNSPIKITSQPLQKALSDLQQRFDHANGGFGSAPKFPQPSKLEFLLEYKSNMAADTLVHMSNGGIYDQIEGGFFRYAVDASWQIPHFEKMLYDNAQLLYLYTLAAKKYDHPHFAVISREIAHWTINKMQSSEGGYFSSIDADSEGHEGKFYVWTKTEIQSLLQDKEYSVVQLYYGLDKESNFENQWHFHREQSLASVATHLNISLSETTKILISANEKLLQARSKRIPPTLDKKILTAWNSLMIKAMMVTGCKLQAPEFIASAQQAILFIQQKLWHNKRLLASYAEGKAYIEAYLDDYAFLIDALISSLQISWQTDHLLFAIDLADTLIEHYYDATGGGFFFTADDQEKVLYRPKSMMDEAIPAGNGIIVRAFLTLGYLLGEKRYLEIAEKTLQASWPYLEKYPEEHCTLLLALKEFLEPTPIIVLRGTDIEMKKWQTMCEPYCSNVFAIPKDAHKLPGLLAMHHPGDKTRAYICQGTHCSAVIEDIQQFKQQCHYLLYSPLV